MWQGDIVHVKFLLILLLGRTGQLQCFVAKSSALYQFPLQPKFIKVVNGSLSQFPWGIGCLRPMMSMLQWIADIGADAEWGKGSCAKEGTIPPTKLRRSGIADPATQIWGGGRSHSPKQDPEGGGGKESEKFKKQSLKGPLSQRVAENDFLAGELWIHQGGVRY